ncbi:MAG: alpha/beta fold hydrolase [Chloroflexi bacterium]|nr:alpha/beta fold hydrolase [Chloroflexota bacterium]
MSQRSAYFDYRRTEEMRLGYLLHLPTQVQSTQDKKWPAIIFLHGVGERGKNLKRLKVYAIPQRVESESDFPFITVSPQCPDKIWWPEIVRVLDALIDHALERYPIDPERIYLTGLSMGGFGAWALAAYNPQRFAALAVVCGGNPWSDGFDEHIQTIRHIPLWVFHGAKDDTVPLSASEKMVEALKSLGADVRFTIYPEAGHDAWTPTYNNPELYTWLLQHTRKGE